MQEFEGEEAEAAFELGTRSLLPLSDDEIVDIYLASEQARTGEPTTLREALRYPAVRQGQVFDAALFGCVVWLIASLFLPTLFLGFPPVVWGIFAFVVVRLLGRSRITGLFSYVKVRSLILSQHSGRRKMVDPHADHVLETVVSHLTRKPIAERDRLVGSIAVSRNTLKSSLERLQNIVATLNKELEPEADESLNLLLASKRDAAAQCARQLKSLDRELRAQAERATAAVAPLEEMKRKFDKIQQVSNSLAHIQKAHGLAQDMQAKVEENRLQIQYLQAAAQNAISKLTEIESIVQAKDQARREVERF